MGTGGPPVKAEPEAAPPVCQEEPAKGGTGVANRADAHAEFAIRVLIAVTIAGLFWIAWKVVDVLLLGFGGVLMAVILRKIARWIHGWTGLPTAAAVLVTVLVIAGTLAAFGMLVGDQVVQQTQQLIQQIPKAISSLRGWLTGTALGEALFSSTGAFKADRLLSGDVLGQVTSMATGLLIALGDFIVILFVGLFLAWNPGLYVNGLLALLPRGARDNTRAALFASGDALWGWLAGQLVSMVAVGIFTTLGLWALGMPLYIALGVLAGLLDFIPFIGPWLAAIPAVLVAFGQSPQMALWVALLFLLIQQIEGNLLLPLAQRWAVQLPPALAVVAGIAAALVLGPLGLLLAVPLTVALREMVRQLYIKDTLGEPLD